MNTEITDIKKFEGWVLYDADCRMCTNLAGRVRHLLAARRLEMLPLQTPWVRERLALPESELLAEMRLLTPEGTVFGGADAFLEICRHYRIGRVVYLLGRVPIVAKILHAGYRWIARNRNCVNEACDVKKTDADERRQLRPPLPSPLLVEERETAITLPVIRGIPVSSTVNFYGRGRRRLADFLPLVALPCLALGFRAQLTPWVFMWAMAFALYAGCKWLTYREALRHGLNPGQLRTWGYLLAWPGMDAAKFLDAKNVPVKPGSKEWVMVAVKIGLGAILLGVVTRLVYPLHPLLDGWVGMSGIILLLHFGWFHVAALLWRRRGVAATPMMRNPLRAKSVTEFWGERWNTAFNEIAFRFTYRPLRRLTAPGIATLLVFGLSGVIHELVISLPARAGYGLPTAYFLMQGLGVIGERTRAGRKLGLGRGLRGWLFTVFVTTVPAFWLFHPPFIHNVILPMLTAIGAT